MHIRVYYEDTDANGIVYHTAYIKYCERARSELFFAKGLSPMDMVNKDAFFVVKSLNARFLGSAKLGDRVEVRTTNQLSKRSYVVLLQEILLADKLIFSMTVTVVYLSHGKPDQIPPDIMDLLTIE